MKCAAEAPHDRRTLAALAVVTLAAAVARVAFTAATVLPRSDPWRHMALVRNLRAGEGFTLFDGQPYVWYGPLWYRVAALVPPERVGWVAAAFSTAAVPLFAVYLARAAGGWRAALAGGLAMALSGPMVAATCQLGAEGFAVFLLCAALAASTHRGTRRGELASGALSGVLFGLAAATRLQFSLNAFLFLPLVVRSQDNFLPIRRESGGSCPDSVPRKRTRAAAFALGLAAPLAAQWWRNHLVIARHPFVFTWDGLATRAEDYGPLSTLAVQLHPAVVEATRALYERIFAHGPEWLFTPGGRFRWETVLLAALGLGCVLASRRVGAILAAAATVVALGLLDPTRSGYFARNWVGLLPVLFLGIGAVAGRLASPPIARGRAALAVVLVGAAVAAGAGALRPDPPLSIEAVTPPPEALSEERYFVAGGYYHPQALIWRYPEKRFLGLPRDAGSLDELARLHPEFRNVVWHPFGSEVVQPEVFAHVQASGRFRTAWSGANAFGYEYLVHRER